MIHTVGPVHSTDVDRSPLLRACYQASLSVAAELGARSVAYPLISAGVYRWPKHDAVAQALKVLCTEPSPVELVRLVLYDLPTRLIAEQVFQTSDHSH